MVTRQSAATTFPVTGGHEGVHFKGARLDGSGQVDDPDDRIDQLVVEAGIDGAFDDHVPNRILIDPGTWVDEYARNGLGAILDTAATLGIEQQHRATSGVIDGKRDEELVADVDQSLDQQFLDREVAEGHRKHAFSRVSSLIRSVHDQHAAERLATCDPGLDLDDRAPTELSHQFRSLTRSSSQMPFGHLDS